MPISHLSRFQFRHGTGWSTYQKCTFMHPDLLGHSKYATVLSIHAFNNFMDFEKSQYLAEVCHNADVRGMTHFNSKAVAFLDTVKCPMLRKHDPRTKYSEISAKASMSVLLLLVFCTSQSCNITFQKLNSPRSQVVTFSIITPSNCCRVNQMHYSCLRILFSTFRIRYIAHPSTYKHYKSHKPYHFPDTQQRNRLFHTHQYYTKSVSQLQHTHTRTQNKTDNLLRKIHIFPSNISSLKYLPLASP